MSRIPLINPETASPDAREVFDEIKGAFGMTPNLFKTFAHRAAILRAEWDRVMAVMAQGELPRKLKEIIAVLVSQDNGCRYCVDAHTASLRSIGVSDEEIETIKADITKGDFTQKELSLISFARRANAEPLKISQAEFEQVKKRGATDPEIVEALEVMALFTGFNKFLDALQVDIDF